MDWISIEDKKPEKLQEAIFKFIVNDIAHYVYGERTTHGNQLRFISKWHMNEEGHFYPNYTVISFSFITHWMPLDD